MAADHKCPGGAARHVLSNRRAKALPPCTPMNERAALFRATRAPANCTPGIRIVELADWRAGSGRRES